MERTVSLNNLSLVLDKSGDILIDIDEVISMCAVSDDEEEKADNIEITDNSNMEPKGRRYIAYFSFLELTIEIFVIFIVSYCRHYYRYRLGT